MVTSGEEARSTRDSFLLVMESRLSIKFPAISQASVKILGPFLSYPCIFNSLVFQLSVKKCVDSQLTVKF